MEKDPLGVGPETMRRLGYRTVDMLVDRIVRLRDLPVLRHGTPAELAARLDGRRQMGPRASSASSSSSAPTSCRS
jgi:hypothetical protein